MTQDFILILIFIVLGLGLFANFKVKSTFKSMSRLSSSFNGTAADAAMKILRDNGNSEVSFARIEGELTDNYNPGNNTLYLSEPVVSSNSIAAIGVAAHEAGHAMQQFEGYGFLRLRTALVPAVNIGSNLAFPLFVLGLAMSFSPLMNIGIILFSLAVVFSVITLPVEIDASRRAVRMLTSSGILTSREEIRGVKKVLSAAAMTYVVSALMAVLQLVRLLLIRSSRRD